MTHTAALIVHNSSPMTFAGLDLVERALRVVNRAGIVHVQVVGDDEPFADAPVADVLIVLPERVIVEPAAIRDLLHRGLSASEDAAVMVDADDEATGLMMLSRGAVERVRNAPRVRSGMRRLKAEAKVGAVRATTRYATRLRALRDVARVEAEYLSHSNGGTGEGFFTRTIRRCSIPLSRRLLHVSVTTNELTVTSFVLAVLSGLAFSLGTFGAGTMGALCCWASIVLAYSAGEVARATLSDVRRGASADTGLKAPWRMSSERLASWLQDRRPEGAPMTANRSAAGILLVVATVCGASIATAQRATDTPPSTMTVVGCVQHTDQPGTPGTSVPERSAAPEPTGVVANLGAPEPGFILTDAAPVTPGVLKESPAELSRVKSPMRFILFGNESELGKHEGHRVRVSGVIEPSTKPAEDGATGTSGSNQPKSATERLKVTSVEMIAQDCTPR